MKITIASPVSDLHGVGPKTVDRLAALRIHTIEDLLFTKPRQYEDRSKITDIIDVEEGHSFTIRGVVEKVQQRKAWKRRMTITEALISDKTGSINAIWFNQPYIKDQLKKDEPALFSGKVDRKQGKLQMQTPVFEMERKDQTHVGRIVPEYDLTFGITQKQIRYFVKQALEHVLPLEDSLPEDFVKKHGLLDITKTVQQLHFPNTPQEHEAALRRLYFDTVLLMHLYVEEQRGERQSIDAPAIPFSEAEVADFVKALPFKLTGAQKRSAWDVLQNLENPYPMHRLLVGDVGAGKTVVAAMAAYQAHLRGYQTAFMAPTEVLANQHYASLQKVFADTKVTLTLLTRETSKEHKKTAITADIIVGTHALIQDGIEFNAFGPCCCR